MPRNLNNITQTNGYTVQKPTIPLEWSSSYQAKTNQGTGDCGRIIPVFFRELMPNQTVNISQDIAIQFTPFVSNLFHEIKGELITYFVPYRICAFMRSVEVIDSEDMAEADQLKWEAFIDGGLTGQDTRKLDTIDLNLLKTHYKYKGNTANQILLGTLADYFGMPIHSTQSDNTTIKPNKLLWNAYNLIYNTKLRNPDITQMKKYIPGSGDYSYSDYLHTDSVAIGYWNADRFTRARKIQLRGITPSIPLRNELVELAIKLSHSNESTHATETMPTDWANVGNPPIAAMTNTTDGTVEIGLNAAGQGGFYGNSVPKLSGSVTIPEDSLNSNLDYNEFLYNLAILRYETNNARIKPRYTEFLKYRFGIVPQDSRFQEPEWVDSSSFNIGVDTVTATGNGSFTPTGEATARTSTLGEITGQGWGGGQKMNYSYKAEEHGVLMTLMIIKPLSVYEGGLERFWWGDRTRFDYPTPELMNTPDNKIWKGELKYTGLNGGPTDDDKGLFGWQSIYDEYRTMTNQVCGLLRPSLTNGLKTYTLARFFSSQPEINDEFLLCRPPMDRIKQYPNQPDFIFFHRAEMKTAMPMPLINEPVNI